MTLDSCACTVDCDLASFTDFASLHSAASINSVADGWSLVNRGSDGKIVADPNKFPSGIKHVSDYIHAKGSQQLIITQLAWIFVSKLLKCIDHYSLLCSATA